MGDLYWIKIDRFQGLVGPTKGRGGARESKNGPKMGSKGPKKAQKMAILTLFRPFFDVFQPMCILSSPLKSRAPCVEAWPSRKKFRDGILRYEGSKSGILETCLATQRSKVWLASGQVRFTIPNRGLTTFLMVFGSTATMLIPRGQFKPRKWSSLTTNI